MRNIYLNLFITLLTFGVGTFAGSIRVNQDSIDQRFADSLRKFYLQNAEKCRDKYSAATQTQVNDLEKLEKMLNENPPQNISKEDLEKMKSHIRVSMAFEKSNNQLFIRQKSDEMNSINSVEERVANDLKNAAENCRNHSYSRQKCDQIKEDAIKDIEENLLAK